MKKLNSIVISFLLSLLFSGCSLVYSDIKQAYVDAKVIYSDEKYVLYEIENEVERVKEERDAKK